MTSPTPSHASSSGDHRAGPGVLEPDDDGFHVSELLEKLRRRWKLIALVVLFALVVSGVRYAMTPKMFQTHSRIQIERRSLTPMLGNQNPWLENWWNMEYYPTQYQLLTSRGLAERVVLDLGLADDLAPEGSTGGPLTPEAFEIGAASEAEAAELGRMAQGLLGGLDVQPVRNTQLVDIIYRSGDPEFAARAANGFAEAFIDWGITTRSDTAGRASSFLSTQIDALKQEIQEKEAQLQAFSREQDIVALDQDSNVNLQRLETLNRDYMEAKAERIDHEASYQELLEAPRETVADRVSDGTVTELMRDQLALEREYENKLQTYKPEWPAMVELAAEIDKGRQHLDEVVERNFQQARQEAWAEFQTALRRERALEQELDAVKGTLLDQSSAAVEYSNLRVEIETRRDLLDEVLRRQSETDVAARLQTTRESNVRVIDRALVPGYPYRPSLRRDLSRGGLFGLLAGLGLVLLIDYMDRTLKRPEEVERHLRLPNLAVIPDLEAGGRAYGMGAYGYGGSGAASDESKGRSALRRRASGSKTSSIELLPHERPRLAVSEAYRALRTALLLSSADELRLVAVTSAGAGEGKTATSVNLAIVMAQLGRRVLLVDADLRRPRLHEVFGVSNRAGLVNILAEGEDPENAHVLTGVKNLSLIPSGPIPPNPSELLSSSRMGELLERARGRFDFVVIDTPPVLAVTDATLVGAMVDGVVLCLRAGKVTREDARACRDRLDLAEVKILGTVLNRHRADGPGSKRYSYYEAYARESAEDAPRDGAVSS